MVGHTRKAYIAPMNADTALRAAQEAQEAALEYLLGVAEGEIEPNRREAEALAEKCERTFKAWMQACGVFSVH